MINISRWQVWLILGVCLFGLVVSAPNLLDKKDAEALPSYVPSAQFNLGLDLQGGAHLLMEVDTKRVFKDYLDDIRDSLRKDLREARVTYRNLGATGKSITFTVPRPEQIDAASKVLRELVREASPQIGAIASGPPFEANMAGNTATLTLTEAGEKARIDRAVEQSIEVLRRRIDETGTTEPTIQRQGRDRILVQVPGVEDPERIKKILGKTAKMTFHLVDQSVAPSPGMRPPPGTEVLPDNKKNPQVYYLLRKRVEVSGEHLVDAQQSFDQGRPVVTFRFNSIGARKFGRTTSQNILKPFAIVLDGEVISAPVIQSAILGGSGIITGGFTVKTASDLALLLRAGALPAPLQIIEERTVGAGLGADAIAAGKIASVLGLILVVIFMVAAYGRFGLMANIALAMNLILLAALLSMLQATLTLPGIAGIVLTIGMAVDANVLIFERIREEVRAGRTPMSAIDTGYRRALTTIIDSNLTTFIAAGLLFIFGSGPVKGFGVTLMLGLITSMFTAIMVTRLMVVGWWRRTRPATLPI